MIYAILVLSSFVAALVSGTAGFGGALLLLPVVVACIGTQAAVPVLTLAQLLGNLSRMAFGFRQIDWKSVGLFSITALPMTALGALGFSVLPTNFVIRCVGGALILLAGLQLVRKLVFRSRNKPLLVGGACTGLLSGLAGSAGPVGAAVFLMLNLSPIAYIASEATTATAMHLMKTVVYSKLLGLDGTTLITGLTMGAAMIAGTFVSNRWIRNMEKGRFQRYVAVLLVAVGTYMLVTGA